MIDDEGLLQEFVAEGKEHLSTIEPDLLILERQEDVGAGRQELINRVFRAIHSIKGAAGFFGFETLKRLSHVMESVLMQVRDGKLEPTPDVMEPLLVGVDKLFEMFQDIDSSDKVECEDVIVELHAILEGKKAAATPAKTVVPTEEKKKKAPASKKGAKEDNGEEEATKAGATKPVSALDTPLHPVEIGAGIHSASTLQFNPDAAAVDLSLSKGQSLYALTINCEQDIHRRNQSPQQFIDALASTGVVIDIAYDETAIPDLTVIISEPLTLRVLYGTVLEPDLISHAYEILESQIEKMTREQAMAHAHGPSAVVADATTNVAVTDSNIPSEKPPQKIIEPPAVKAVSEEPAKAKARPSNEAAAETVRVKVELLNKLMDLAGEMVLSRNQLIRTMQSEEARQLEGLHKIVQNINLVTTELQENIMQTRMQQIGSIFAKFPRVVRDMAKKLGKEIQLDLVGEDVELDKSIIESLSDPLTHLIRNCCDHALETPQQRVPAGKPAMGKITLKAYHEGGQINISIRDDGAGIDHEKIASKAFQKGLITESDLKRMSVQDQVHLIFLPGFSTAETVSDISGRGVGMDVVKTNIEKIGGHISVNTILGKGTTIILRIPLTLAIIPSLIVGVCGHRFAIPQINLIELVRVRAADVSSRIEKVAKAPVLRLRGKLLPLIRLSDILGFERSFWDPFASDWQTDRREEIADERQAKVHETPRGLINKNGDMMQNRRQSAGSDYNILVLNVGVHQYGLIVDEIHDTEEIVVKPLSNFLKDTKFFAGATIMGDGRVALILDTGGIAHHSKLSFSEIENEERRRRLEQASLNAASNTRLQSVILFSNHLGDEVFAVPLSSILRLEKFNQEDIKHVGGREFYSYRGKALPIIRLEHHLPVNGSSVEAKDAYFIIPKAGEGVAGIFASKIIDTVEVSMDLDKSHIRHPGVLGSTMIQGQMTLFLDPHRFLDELGLLQATVVQEGALAHGIA